MVYFERTTNLASTAMNLVGLTLRPEANGGYQVLGVSTYQGQSAVAGVRNGDRLIRVNDKKVKGLTMGAVWSLLSGKPGTTLRLTLSRQGKEFSVPAATHCFLCENKVRAIP